MASSNPIRWLAEGSDDRKLALELFWGRTYEAFRDHAELINIGTDPDGDVQRDVIAQKVVTEGYSWRFPMFGTDPDAEEHTPGTELLGQQIVVDDSNVTVDDIRVTHMDLPIDQINVSHFDVVGQFGMQLGRGLARKIDNLAFRVAVNAARTGALTKNGDTIHSGGNVVERVGASGIASAYPVSATGAQNFRADAEQLAQIMDEDYVPEEGRYLYIGPYIRRVLGQDPEIFDVRYSPDTPNRLNSRSIGELAGFQVVHSQKMGTLNQNFTDPKFSKYSVDTRYDGSTGQPAALAFCGAQSMSAAMAFVSFGGVQTHMEQDERRNTLFMKAQIMCGLGVLNPWCAGEIRVDDA